MVYETQIWGMHLFWWFIWVFLLIWIFATPYDIPGQRSRRLSPLDVLKLRFANGQISSEEYKNSKAILEDDSTQSSK
jgi:putative membrane protein